MAEIDSVAVTVKGPNAIVIDYRLKDNAALVTATIETNAGQSAWVPVAAAKTFRGDVGKVLRPGAHQFVWKARADLPDRKFAADSVRARLSARRIGNPPDFVVIDLEKETDAISYYETAAAVPGGVQDDAYKTTKLLLRRMHAANVRWRLGATADDVYGAQQGVRERPHAVTLTQDYYIGVYELTQRQYEIVAGYPGSTVANATPSATRALVNAGMRPVTNVSAPILRGAETSYCWTTNGHDVDPTLFFGLLRTRYGFAFDLPTGAQWEYACRAGTTTATFVDDGQIPHDYSWSVDNSTTDDDGVDYSGLSYVHVVGKKLPNPWGLYDILGNACEICLDWYVGAANAVPDGELVDPVGPAAKLPDSNYAVQAWRGGSCLTGGMMGERQYHRSSAQLTWVGAFPNMGFRVCCPAVAH